MLSVTRTRNAIESVKAFYCLFISVLEIQLSEEEGWDSINWFNLTTHLCLSQARTWISNPIFCCPFCVLWFEVRGGCHIFVPVPSQDPDFKNHMFNDLRWEVIVCFIYIGGIVDHHCVNFLFAAPSFTPNSVFIIWIQLFLLLIFLFRHGYPVLIIQNNANSDKIENSV